MFNKVLVAIDGSKMSEKVLRVAEQFAKEHGAALTLIHVAKDLVLPTTIVVTDYVKILDEMRIAATALLEEAQHKLKLQDVKADVMYKQGTSISHVIVEMAKEQSYDLIIIGSRGLGNIKGLMLGGVSQKVSQLSDCPVLLVK
jgi:nucleotide-binding universal stress UspA family protein